MIAIIDIILTTDHEVIGCLSKPLYPGHILAIMYGGGGGANVQLNTPLRQMKKQTKRNRYVGLIPVS